MKIVTAWYVLLMIVVPPRWVDGPAYDWWVWPRRRVYDLILVLYEGLGVSSPHSLVQFATYLVLMAFLLPWAVMALFGRGRPFDLGWRRPNRLVLRIVSLGLLVATPFLYWMVRGAGFAAFYQRYFEAGALTVVCYFVVALFAEHFFFHGVMPAAFRPGHRWPQSSDLDRSARTTWRRRLQWLGMAQPATGAAGAPSVARWLGLKEGCAGAILVSGLLFGAVHCGKDGRELLLSYPGGIFLGYMAYRCNSWFAPFLLHLGTAATGAALFLLTQSR